MAAEEWSQLPLFSSMSSHASSPLSERPLPILSLFSDLPDGTSENRLYTYLR